MPKKSQHSALARQWELLRLIPQHGNGITASALTRKLEAAGYAASKRTIERDLAELELLFGLHCAETPGAANQWSWMAGSGVNLPALTVVDAISISLVEDLVRPLIPAAFLDALEARFGEARAKIIALSRTNKAMAWTEKVRHAPPTLPLLPPLISPGVLATVQEALLDGMQLEADYQSAGEPDAKRLRLHPLGLVQRGPVTYLVATAFEYKDVRLYALHRIRRAERQSEKADVPQGFSLDAYVDAGALQFGSGRTIKLDAWVCKDFADILRETPLAVDQRLTEVEDGMRVCATVVDSWQLRYWILSQGESIAVNLPRRLRNEIAHALSNALTRYQQEERNHEL